MRQHALKLNPLNCAFKVIIENFLGFLGHKRGTKVDANKAKSIIHATPPTNKEF